MLALTRILFSLSMSLWIGSMFFFSFFTAPTLFKELPRPMAGEVISKIFPRYYLLGYCTLALALFSLLLTSILSKSFPWIRMALLSVMIGATLYGGLNLQPKTHVLRTVLRTMEDSPEKDLKQLEFNRLHKISVILNSIVLLSGLIVLILTAARSYPT